MEKGRTHIVGAGLAGLSAALTSVEGGRAVTLYEGAQHAGGRCRSYFDSRLGCTIDNGNHLVLSGNRSVARYLKRAGAEDALEKAPEARFPFYDVESGERWEVVMNDGPVPTWIFDRNKRPKGVSLAEMLRAGRLLLAGDRHTVAELCGEEGLATERFLEPMAVAVVNLPPRLASAKLLRATALEAWRDGRLARPMFAPQGLGAALIEPALAALKEKGGDIQYGRLLSRLEQEDGRVTALHFVRGDAIKVGREDRVVLALPPHRLADILPDAQAPSESASILNAHFRLADPSALAGKPKLLGLTRSLTQWIFLKGDIVSLTVSAAEYIEGSTEKEKALLTRLWRESVAALGLPENTSYEAARLVREKRATFLQTPDNAARRPSQRTKLSNLFLAGDFVDTGLPATIEGAVRSGERAAQLAA
ncbi:hydroxysqualene dehydroxylase HpnE [Parvularcula maris]|nr:hydroxysqualene dehydroxylase HpnE [Parvularcula maris]